MVLVAGGIGRFHVKPSPRIHKTAQIEERGLEVADMFEHMRKNHAVEFSRFLGNIEKRTGEPFRPARQPRLLGARRGGIDAAQAVEAERAKFAQHPAIGAAHVQNSHVAVALYLRDFRDCFANTIKIERSPAAAGGRLVVGVFGKVCVEFVVIGLRGGGIGKTKSAAGAVDHIVAVLERMIVGKNEALRVKHAPFAAITDGAVAGKSFLRHTDWEFMLTLTPLPNPPLIGLAGQFEVRPQVSAVKSLEHVTRALIGCSKYFWQHYDLHPVENLPDVGRCFF